MKRVVLDTNILVSGLLSPLGPPGFLVRALLDGHLSAVCTDEILAEYREVLARSKFGLHAQEVGIVLEQIAAKGLMVSPFLWNEPLPDPDDGKFLAAARMVRCPLVTGNLKHYPSSSRGEVRVVTAREFLETAF